MAFVKDSFKFISFALFGLACLLGAQGSARAQGVGGMSLIRDVEIETALAQWARPVFEAAGIDPKGVKIILVQNSTLNAFVAGGSNIFIYTGLIEATKTPEELIGVIAHETGHIAGGHLVKSREALERASYESIVGAILGVGAAIATGDSGAAVAISAGSGSMAQRRFLAHSRVQESSADQAALTFLESAKINPTGLSTFMEQLKAQIYLPADQQIEYVLTHPLVENRIEVLNRRIAQSPYKTQATPEKWKEQHTRMKAKLVGFIAPGRVPWTYDDRDMSVPAQYARAIAAYRNSQVDDALSKMDALLKAEPQNPYFLELKGQMLADFGRVEEAVTYYRKAVSLLPEASLLRISLAHALIQSAEGSKGGAQNSVLTEAIENLERSAREETRSTRIYRLLATAYGKMGDENMAKVNLAEEAVLQGRFDYAREQAEAVINNSSQGGKAFLKAKDVLSFIDQHEKG